MSGKALTAIDGTIRLGNEGNGGGLSAACANCLKFADEFSVFKNSAGRKKADEENHQKHSDSSKKEEENNTVSNKDNAQGRGHRARPKQERKEHTAQQKQEKEETQPMHKRRFRHKHSFARRRESEE